MVFCKSRNGESGSGVRGMMEMRRSIVGMRDMQGIKVEIMGIRVGIRGMRGFRVEMMGMQGIRMGMRGMRGIRVRIFV